MEKGASKQWKTLKWFHYLELIVIKILSGIGTTMCYPIQYLCVVMWGTCG